MLMFIRWGLPECCFLQEFIGGNSDLQALRGPKLQAKLKA